MPTPEPKPKKMTLAEAQEIIKELREKLEDYEGRVEDLENAHTPNGVVRQREAQHKRAVDEANAAAEYLRKMVEGQGDVIVTLKRMGNLVCDLADERALEIRSLNEQIVEWEQR